MQKAVSVPSLAGSPAQSPHRRMMSTDPAAVTPGTPQRANSMSNIEGTTGKNVH